MALSPEAALPLLLFAAPVCLWVAWSDMRFMRIPNPAVLTLVAIFAAVGPFVLPFGDWSWRLLQLPIVLLVGFGLNAGGLVGAGDAKFAAAMAPFVARHDLPFLTVLFATVLLAAFALHRLMRRIPQVRAGFPDWASWTHDDFPMGLALAGTLLFYLALAALAI